MRTAVTSTLLVATFFIMPTSTGGALEPRARPDLLSKALLFARVDLKLLGVPPEQASPPPSWPETVLGCVALRDVHAAGDALRGSTTGHQAVYISRAEDAACFLVHGPWGWLAAARRVQPWVLWERLPAAAKLSAALFHDPRPGGVLGRVFDPSQGGTNATVARSHARRLTVTFAPGAALPGPVWVNATAHAAERAAAAPLLGQPGKAASRRPAASCNFFRLALSGDLYEGRGAARAALLSGLPPPDVGGGGGEGGGEGGDPGAGADRRHRCLAALLGALARSGVVAHVEPLGPTEPHNGRVARLVQVGGGLADMAEALREQQERPPLA